MVEKYGPEPPAAERDALVELALAMQPAAVAAARRPAPVPQTPSSVGGDSAAMAAARRGGPRTLRNVEASADRHAPGAPKKDGEAHAAGFANAAADRGTPLAPVVAVAPDRAKEGAQGRVVRLQALGRGFIVRAMAARLKELRQSKARLKDARRRR